MSRIIAGSRGGRRLSMPTGDRTRPTTDRVREALFSAIESWAGGTERSDAPLIGLAMLDLYAGSGAVGLEAASRGAEPVVLVEAAQKTVTLTTRRNVADLDLRAEVRVGRVETLIRQPADRSYDLVFADPPYDVPTTDLNAILSDLQTNGWIAENGLAIVERSSRTPSLSWPTAFQTWTKRYGETVLEFGAR